MPWTRRVPRRRCGHAGPWRAWAAIAERGLHARWPPAVAAARRGHALVVEQVGDGLEAFPGVAEAPDAVGQLGRVVSEPGAAPRRPAGRRLELPALDLAQHTSDVRARSRRGVQPNVKRDEVAIASVKPIEQRYQFPQRTGHVREASHEQRRRRSSADAFQSPRRAVTHDPDHIHADPRTVGAGVGLYARRVVREGGTIHRLIVRKYIA